jgi:predicted TIM-barrel enzyme
MAPTVLLIGTLDTRGLVLCHGGPLAEPEDAQYVLDRSEGIVGFFGALSMERLPTEVAMTKNRVSSPFGGDVVA